MYSILGAYLTCFMATSTLAVVLSIIILHFHHHSGGHPPPQWMKTLICGYIEKTVQCLNHNEIEFHHSVSITVSTLIQRVLSQFIAVKLLQHNQNKIKLYQSDHRNINFKLYLFIERRSIQNNWKGN